MTTDEIKTNEIIAEAIEMDIAPIISRSCDE